jgi:DNA-binding MarR family transcriptional regulator
LYANNIRHIALNDTDREIISLNRWEIQILKCIKANSKTEKKIAKEVGLDISVISPLITNLMLQGFVERTRKRRMHFSSKEYFSTTIEGVAALEETTRGTSNVFWNQIASILKDHGEKILIEWSNKSLPLKIMLGAIKATYRLAKSL